MPRLVPSHARLALLVGACLAHAAAGQLVVQSPRPTGRSLGGVAFNSPTHGFVVGANRHLLETSDAGETWTARMAGNFSSDPFYTITFADPTHVYLAGNNQDAYRSTDAGATWTQMTSFPAGSARVFDFVTPTTGLIGLNGAICWTPDAGLTWPLRSGYPHCPIMFGMDFRDADLGLAAGIRSTPYNDGGIYRSDDGGRTWSLVFDGIVNDVLWLDATSAVATSGLDFIRSDDAGLTWYTIAFGTLTTGLGDIDRAGTSSTLGGVSLSGDIWVSPDLGLSWFQVVQGIGVLPATWTISFSDALHGWVVGDAGLTYRTTDGGWTWQLINNGCGDEVTDIDFTADDSLGVAVTFRGFVFRTRDRGAHWDVRRLRETGIIFGREEGLRAVQAVDSHTIVAGGAGGIFFRSDDGGDTWISLGYPYTLPATLEIDAIKFVDPLKGWVAGLYGPDSVYQTLDGGYSWTPVSGVGGSVIALDASGANVWAATAGNLIYRSTDRGETWTGVAIPGVSYGVADMKFCDPLNGWAVGWYGTNARTTDGGLSWTTVHQPQNETCFSVALSGPSEIWSVGYDATTFGYFYKKSTNAGATWTRTNLGQFEEWFTQIHLSPAGRFWLGGAAGKILYSPAGPLTVALPADVPPQFPPGAGATVPVRITPGEESIVPGTETLWFRRNPAEAFAPIPLEHLGADAYRAAFPALRCADSPQFYLAAQGSHGTTVTLPATAPASFYSFRVGTFETGTLLQTGFDTGLPPGWSASGLWHISSACQPAGACGSGPRAYFGFDASCTFNNGQRVQGVLRSPLLSLPQLQPGQSLSLTFCSALDTEYPDGTYGDDDYAQLWWVSGSQQAPIQWFTDHQTARTQTFDLALHAGHSGYLEWRFDSINSYMNSFRGWHVDNVLLTGPLPVCHEACPPDFNADGLLNTQDFFDFLSAFFVDSPAADFNRDLLLNSQDFFDFLAAFFTGC